MGSIQYQENSKEYVLVCAFCRKIVGFFSTTDLVKDEGWQIQCTDCTKLR